MVQHLENKKREYFYNENEGNNGIGGQEHSSIESRYVAALFFYLFLTGLATF